MANDRHRGARQTTTLWGMKHCMTFALCLLPALAVAAAQTIYRCPGPGGAPLFTTTACNSGHQLKPNITNGYRLPKLTREQQRTLTHLAKRPHQRTPGRDQQASKRNAEKLLQKRKRLCAQARNERTALQEQRRRGYSTADTHVLDAKEQALRDQQRRYC